MAAQYHVKQEDDGQYHPLMLLQFEVVVCPSLPKRAGYEKQFMDFIDHAYDWIFKDIEILNVYIIYKMLILLVFKLIEHCAI